MNKMWIITLYSFFALSIAANAKYVDAGGKRIWVDAAKAKATLIVTDQDGLPVANASVRASLFNSKYKDYRKLYDGTTDTNGVFVIEGTTYLDFRYTITKDGYYFTRGTYNFRESSPEGEKAVVDGKWQPWNPVLHAVLKKKINPVPMYAKRVQATCPMVGQPVGYDLIVGDWVAPFGQGSTDDLLFTVQGRLVAITDRSAELKLEFSSAHDGIQEFVAGRYATNSYSEYISPYNASVDGYRSIWLFETRFTSAFENRVNPGTREWLNFMFRVRTKIDEKGKVVSANYGKIYGDIRCDFRDFSNPTNIGVYFTYYLNPIPNDRNLEFAPGQNIFKNLGPFEQVLEP